MQAELDALEAGDDDGDDLDGEAKRARRRAPKGKSGAVGNYTIRTPVLLIRLMKNSM